MHRIFGTTVLAALLLLGCAAAVRQTQPFDTVLLDYMERLRWQDWNGVARYMPEEERAPFLQRMTSAEDLHITDVRLEGVEAQDGGTRAIARIVIEYYLLPSVTVKTLRVSQEWSYHEAKNGQPAGWRLLTPLPPLTLQKEIDPSFPKV